MVALEHQEKVHHNHEISCPLEHRNPSYLKSSNPKKSSSNSMPLSRHLNTIIGRNITLFIYMNIYIINTG
jgi:hypothetical protein